MAANAGRVDVPIGDAYADVDTGDDADNDAGGRVAQKRPYPPQDYGDKEAMSTYEGTPKAAYTAAARGAAARRAVTQREDEADSEADANSRE